MSKPTIPANAKLVFKGTIFEVYQWEQQLYDGSTQTFERLKRPDTVQVIPVLANGNIVMLNEEQPDVGSFISFPGGRVDGDESVENAAARELSEETGYKAEKLTPWFSSNPLTNKIVWEIHYFIATGLTKVDELHLDPGEKISLREVSFDEFLSMPDNPNFSDFCGGGYLNELLLRAKYNQEKQQELRALLSIGD